MTEYMVTTASHELYTPAQVAELLQVNVKTVHRWLKLGRLPGIKIGTRHWRVKGSDVAKVLENGLPIDGQDRTDTAPEQCQSSDSQRARWIKNMARIRAQRLLG